MLDGPNVACFPNAAYRLKSENADGKPVGSRIKFFPDGTTNELSVYSRPGALDGPELYWTRAGEKKVLRVWRDGMPWDGRFYSESNRNQILSEYTNGVFVSETNLGPARVFGRPSPQKAAAKLAAP